MANESLLLLYMGYACSCSVIKASHRGNRVLSCTVGFSEGKVADYALHSKFIRRKNGKCLRFADYYAKSMQPYSHKGLSMDP